MGCVGVDVGVEWSNPLSRVPITQAIASHFNAGVRGPKSCCMTLPPRSFCGTWWGGGMCLSLTVCDVCLSDRVRRVQQTARV